MQRAHHRYYSIYVWICIYIYVYLSVSNLSSAQAYPHTWSPAQASVRKCAHVRGHRRCRRAQPVRAAPKPRPSASAIVRAAGPGGGAYQKQVRHRRGVPRADVGVERHRTVERLCAEATTRSTPTGMGSHGLGFRVQAEPAARARQRVRTQPIHHHRTLVHGFINPDRFSHRQTKWKMYV